MTERIRVLAVDDAPAVLAVLQTLFTAAGCDIVTAPGPRQGLRILRWFRPQVILTDFSMPHINGMGFAALLRRHPDHRDTPVFVVSGEVCPMLREATLAAGADAWFAKPIDPCALVTAVRAAAAQRQTPAAA